MHGHKTSHLPIRYFVALLLAHPILHISTIRVKAIKLWTAVFRVLTPFGLVYTVGSRFATVRFTTIHCYDTCPVGPSTPHLWCITVVTPASFLYLDTYMVYVGVCV